MKKIIGIDPGFSGAIAVLDPANDRTHVYDMPTLESGKRTEINLAQLVEILRSECRFDNGGVLVVLEKVGAMPKQGVSSTFRFGEGYGAIKGILAALAVPYELSTPQAWKRVMMNGMPKEKDASRLRAIQLFPDVDLSLKKHHGRADALLLAEYARRNAN